MLAKFQTEITFVEVVAKKTKSVLQNAFESTIFRVSIFFHDFHKCDFMTKFCKLLKHYLKFVIIKIQIFLNIFKMVFDFTVHPSSFELRCKNITSARITHLPCTIYVADSHDHHAVVNCNDQGMTV